MKTVAYAVECQGTAEFVELRLIEREKFGNRIRIVTKLKPFDLIKDVFIIEKIDENTIEVQSILSGNYCFRYADELVYDSQLDVMYQSGHENFSEEERRSLLFDALDHLIDTGNTEAYFNGQLVSALQWNFISHSSDIDVPIRRKYQRMIPLEVISPNWDYASEPSNLESFEGSEIGKFIHKFLPFFQFNLNKIFSKALYHIQVIGDNNTMIVSVDNENIFSIHRSDIFVNGMGFRRLESFNEDFIHQLFS